MDKQQLAAAAAVMLAASQGAEIQYKARRSATQPWEMRSAVSVADLRWDWATYDYRVKPKTIKARMYLDKSYGFPETYLCRNKDKEQSIELTKSFVRWLTDWIEVEI